LVFEPPRHGKTELSTRLLSAYFLYRYPHRWVSINSYGANLAEGMSRHAREYFKEGGGVCKSDSNAVDHWETTSNGGMFAAGVGGPILGKGWHLGLIDDCLKNAEEANSETIREKQKDWLETTFLTREEPWSPEDPDGAIVITMQRWHNEDICGYLLEQERQAIEDEEDTENWHIVFFEAIKSEKKHTFPSSCTVEPDWRSPGEALCPERRPLHKLLKIKNRLWKAGKDRYWEALFQQNPVPKDGNIIKREWFKYYEVAPSHFDAIYQSWDTASKLSELNDYTVCTTWGVKENGYYLLDVWRGRVDSPDLIQRAINLADRCLPNYGQLPTLVLIEDKASGTGLIQHLQKMSRINVGPVDPKGIEKMIRLDNEAHAIKAGNVLFPYRAPWLIDFEDELCSAPNGAFDDQCDSLSQFLSHVRLNSLKRGAGLW
jgi:predicted phage terminase large subunit-like protein